MAFGWLTIIDTQETVEHEKPSSVAVLVHSTSEWHTYTIVSRLKNPSLTFLLPFIYTD